MADTSAGSEAELRAGHRRRLRQRFNADPAAVSDDELLELALGYVYLRRDNKIPARRLLQRFGSLSAVMSAPPELLAEVENCGPAIANFFILLREVIARASQDQAPRNRPITLYDIAEMGRECLKYCSEEEVWAATLDKQNRLLNFMKIRHGSLDHVALEPLEIAELMIKSRASSLVLVHNHPGGNYLPSPEDRAVTSRIAEALRHLGLCLHDHVIVTSGACFSMVHDCRIEMSINTGSSDRARTT